MALTATIYHLHVNLSDVDRGVYETLDLRLARHPSESMRYLLTRTIAYCLSYEEGIVFSKEGLSSTEEPPVLIRDPTGLLVAWIDVGSPSAERLHKAAKAARRVTLFTHASLAQLQREASSRAIHKVESIEVWRMEPTFLDALEAKVDRNTKLDLLRDDEQLYVTIGDDVVSGTITRGSLVER
ncbi:YaeQ family protein [Polyangium sp. 6x1]|uniref:YaeQ family protein n=1 Tax=Polyangium sp. 6x1 TaxID=3042689 RepID=UPI002482A6AE|nr:YaeQ family protein [Polyangium sp. 6x1]MDI1442785.1 YaeQ family protein [Polyangium sp. 6x1]